MKQKSKLLLCESCVRYDRGSKRCKDERQIDTEGYCDWYIPQCVGCKHYNFKYENCSATDHPVTVDIYAMKEKCEKYRETRSGVFDRYNVMAAYPKLLGIALVSLILLTISYFILPIISLFLLGLLSLGFAYSFKESWQEITENYHRGLRTLRYRCRFMFGLILVIFAPVIQILFLYEIIPLSYLCWILLGFGLSLALPSHLTIDVRQVESARGIKLPISPASPEETKGLAQKPFGMDISMSEQAMVGMNLVMTVFVVNNTDKKKFVDLKYIAPCFDPQSDSIPVEMESKSRKKIKFIAHLRQAGDYVVSARLLYSQNLVAVVNKQISIKSRTIAALGPPTLKNLLRAGLSGVSVAVVLIEAVPDIISFFL